MSDQGETQHTPFDLRIFSYLSNPRVSKALVLSLTTLPTRATTGLRN
ncbi:MAG: hypothetical protein AAGG11_09815 [Pseudomonadota bacterium]